MRLILEYHFVEYDKHFSAITKPIIYRDPVAAYKDLNDMLDNWLKSHYKTYFKCYCLLKDMTNELVYSDSKEKVMENYLEQAINYNESISQFIYFGNQKFWVEEFISFERINYFFKEKNITEDNIGLEETFLSLKDLINDFKIYTVDEFFEKIEN